MSTKAGDAVPPPGASRAEVLAWNEAIPAEHEAGGRIGGERFAARAAVLDGAERDRPERR